MQAVLASSLQIRSRSDQALAGDLGRAQVGCGEEVAPLDGHLQGSGQGHVTPGTEEP